MQAHQSTPSSALNPLWENKACFARPALRKNTDKKLRKLFAATLTWAGRNGLEHVHRNAATRLVIGAMCAEEPGSPMFLGFFPCAYVCVLR